ncbi:undecaprenyl pyrophosphate phosphatase; bacitracin resistance [Cupriavidus taiwanensis]|uniref:undecaprenyl-diphosphate phosphatase n=1 Tax=Cupriavidus taiwanensis TaxID=164546 RepID=UPI000E125D33|nr:undecaprenyl-diphosphate phosphatase [Cupriavidus taiwanensis]SOZ56878.1 undecaprenyl pyrophosphate phosphatase; bacitracin resistance [Cupriavidus taiwanensis]SOZ79042.1 undecaprenyl pyrophosphate phosphatase; bacitracin resistance [Cupriavidus taiwanensis]SOZ79538.1 undecaprenyl pyrophosphate phosphatase; bacitracin resistance [Cupriavidus taiwanensis]SOZ86601.1 undecaprenyl pyrophosphate phosphatase; bacitracin resistance [Cupriavidus taiwanensis]
MEIALALKAVILGIVEGLTEFLPISSTGHLILAGQLLDFNDEKGKIFEIVIQFGAILAVCWEFRARIGKVVRGLPLSQRFAANVVIASVPAIVLAFIFGKWIKAHLFNPISVALAFIVGGVVILLAEWRDARRGTVSHPQGNALLEAAKAGAPRIESVDDLNWRDALKVGLAQCFALVPGTSRSGATIIGGMLFGLSRQVATEFSFFLAIPVIFGATVYELYKARALLEGDDLGIFAVGFVFAFLSAFLCVRWLLRFVATHDFKPFAWYRIAFGIVVLLTAYTGLVSWHA